MSVEDMFFEQTTQGEDLDHESAAVGALVDKIAASKGIDIDSLSDEEAQRIFASVSEPTTVTTKEAGDTTMPNTAPTSAPQEPQLTVVDVSRELIKIASENNKLDVLQGMTPEQYEDAFNKLAEEMARPDYAARRQAEQEAAKIAQAEFEADYESGRRIARGFHAELQKIAEESAKEEKGEEKKEEKKEEKGEEKEEAKEASRAGTALHNLGQLAKHAPKGIADSARGAAKSVGEHVARNRGKYEAAGAAAAGAAGFGAGRASKKDKEDSKEASDARAQAIIARAEELVKSAGLDPEEFAARLEQAKQASEVDAEAMDLLRALGYETKD